MTSSQRSTGTSFFKRLDIYRSITEGAHRCFGAAPVFRRTTSSQLRASADLVDEAREREVGQCCGLVAEESVVKDHPG